MVVFEVFDCPASAGGYGISSLLPSTHCILLHFACTYNLAVRTPVSIDMRGQLVSLGTGTSSGVPVIGCGCDTCTSPNARNNRTRPGLVLGLPEGNLLI